MVRAAVLTTSLAIALALPGCREASTAEPAGPAPDVRQQTYALLDQVVADKRRQLTNYLDRLQRQASAARVDPVLREAFALRRSYHRLLSQSPATAEAEAAMAALDANLTQHWMQDYGSFYSILFVEPGGDVFYTIGRKGYEGTNILQGEFGATSLGERLREDPGQAFVDYEVSSICNEPAAFFVEPVTEGGACQGWLILQCSVNKVNDLFARHGGLGRTGEAFLVNEDCQMLTESRFRRDSTILKQDLAPENILGKFAEGRGHKVVTDYRGYRALTSFEVCAIGDVKWLLIAKIDEAEVLTEHYRRNRDRLRPLLVEAARQAPSPRGDLEAPEKATVVDLDEFRRAGCQQPLLTYGVKTCTAIVIHLPQTFAYLGHASCYDALYGGDGLDIVSQMVQRVRTYEICPYQMRQLQVEIVAPHTESLGRAIDKLVDEGLFLSQIRFLTDARAASATVWHDCARGGTAAQWNTAGAPVQQASQTPTLADILKQIDRL